MPSCDQTKWKHICIEAAGEAQHRVVQLRAWGAREDSAVGGFALMWWAGAIFIIKVPVSSSSSWSAAAYPPKTNRLQVSLWSKQWAVPVAKISVLGRRMSRRRKRWVNYSWHLQNWSPALTQFQLSREQWWLEWNWDRMFFPWLLNMHDPYPSAAIYCETCGQYLTPSLLSVHSFDSSV